MSTGRNPFRGRGRGRGRGQSQGQPTFTPPVSRPSAQIGTESPGPSGQAHRGRGRGFGGRGYNYNPGVAHRGGFQPPRGGSASNRGGGQSRIFSPSTTSEVDARLLDDSQQAVVDSLRNVEPIDRDHAFRPDFGVLGKPIKLRANFFSMDIPDRCLHEYKVVISPERLSRRIRKQLFERAEQSPDWVQHDLLDKVAHDFTEKLISVNKLPQPLIIKIRYADPGYPVTVYSLDIKFKEDIQTSALSDYLSGDPQYRHYDEILHIISALNTVLSVYPSRSDGGGVRVGRNKHYFSTAFPPVDLGGGLQAWKGFYSSVRTSHKQLMVNVNVCNTAFYKPMNLASAVEESGLHNNNNHRRLGKFVSGLQVKCLVGPIMDTVVTSVLEENAREHRVSYGREQVTVQDYCLRRYKRHLRYPTLPLIMVMGIKEPLPLEFFEILPDQPFRGELTGDQTGKMLKVAARPPSENANAIVNEGLTKLGFRNTTPLLDAFDIKIGTGMTVVPGRVLTAPEVKYGAGTPNVDQEKGSWNMRDVKFAKGAALNNWAVLLIDQDRSEPETDSGNHFTGEDDPNLRKVTQGFMRMCRKSGMLVAPALPPVAVAQLPRKEEDDGLRADAINRIQEVLEAYQPKPILVLVVLYDSDQRIYSGIKRLCDSQLDIATVCVHADKIRKIPGQPQYFANVALKVNMKLGGVNHQLNENGDDMKWLLAVPTMLVGIDVTHPSTESVRYTPSIAAVVASVDNDFAQFPVSLGIQQSRKKEAGAQEIVLNLTKMMIERLELYRKRNKKLPERVLVYRDGVSESQFSQVLEEELKLIRTAFEHFNSGAYRPKLTIVICGKRHHTRFYPIESEDADERGNTKPGTVVDRGVTSVYNFDFFLQAHYGLQGTVRPTHYYVVHDEIGFTADRLQGLTHSISYMFARATKSVSLVSPAYYADLACERGRCYLYSLLSGKSPVSVSKETVMAAAEEMWHGGVTGRNLRDTMFYL